MLARLRLDGFVRRNHQKYEINSGSASEHVSDEALMARYIDEAKTHAAFFEEREAEIDRDASALFFFQAVRMRARQSFNECGFTVIDVTGCADDDALPSGIHCCGIC